MNGLVGKGSSAIMTVSTSQSHTQKAMLRERRRRRKKRREYQKGSLVHVLRAHPQLHQSAPGLCVWATKWSVCGQETVATSSRSPVFTVLLLAFLVAEKWRWTLSPSRKWAPGGPKGWPRGFLAPKPPQEVILYENSYREVMFLNENMHEAEPVPIESDPIQEEQADLQSMFSDAACANVPDDEVDSPDSS